MKKGTKNKSGKLRLRVFRSNKHIYAQVIDNSKNFTIAASSSLCPKLKNQIAASATCVAAKIVGEDIGHKLKNKGIIHVVFDRGNRVYHGRIKALADATRNTGIRF